MNAELRSRHKQSTQPTQSRSRQLPVSNQDKLHEFLLNHADIKLRKIDPTALWVGAVILILINFKRITYGDWLGVTLSLVSLGLGWFIVKSSRISSHARIAIFIGVCFFIGVANLLTHGLIENGRIVLFYACIGITSLNRWRYSLYTLLASSLSILATGYLLQQNLLDSFLVVDHPTVSTSDIMSFTLYFAIFAGVAQLTIHEVFRKLISTWEKQNNAQTELRKQNNLIKMLVEQRADELEELKKSKLELDIYKNELEQMVQQRTHELHIERDRANAASQAKTAFITNISHELRTPLNTVIGYSQLLSEEVLEADPQKTELAKDIGRIEKSGQHLLNLINNLLDLSKIEANKMSPYLEPTSLDTLLEEIRIYAYPLAKVNQNSFVIHSSVENGNLVTDAQKLKQILINLTANAFKFTHSGEVQLIVSQYESDQTPYIKFDVIDNGSGISADFLSSLFEPFSQENFSLARTSAGSGLGLAISRGYARLLGGDIAAESNSGKGSKFTLILPIRYES